MGWRYAMIIIGFITLGEFPSRSPCMCKEKRPLTLLVPLASAIFALRFFLFTFHESPKFLLAKGKDEAALDVLYKIAKFNRAPTPNLTVDDFRLLDSHYAEEQSRTSDEPLGNAPRELGIKELTKNRLRQLLGQVGHLKALFATKRAIWFTVALWIAYMCVPPPRC